MTQKERIQEEIERTLQSHDSVKRAEANPFLYTRIKARMNTKANGWENVFSVLSKPVIAIAILLLVMAVNGWALWGGSGTIEEPISENASELATEYNSVASVNNYDYENIASE